MTLLKKHKFNDIVRFRVFSTIALSILTILVLLPIVLIVIGSISDEKILISTGYTYFPKKLSLDSYYYMVKQSAIILHAYGITILTTIIGTLISVLITSMLAYPMSRPDFRYRKAFAFFVFFTMLFNGGIVSSYIMWTRFFAIKNPFGL